MNSKDPHRDLKDFNEKRFFYNKFNYQNGFDRTCSNTNTRMQLNYAE